MNRNIQLIIPMSGLGQRFIDAGYKDPKPLIEVDGMPIIEHVYNLFPGINDVLFIINKDHAKTTNVKDILLKFCPFATIVEVDQAKKGPVFAVTQAIEHVKENSEIILSYCDYGTEWNFKEFLKEVLKYDGMIPCYKGFHPHMLGSDNYAFCKENNKMLVEIKEKEPFTDNKMNEYASNGTYYFKTGKIVKQYFSELVDKNINIKGEHYISLVYNLLVRDGLKVGIFEINKMLQWGTPYDLEIYKGWSNYFRLNFKKPVTATHSEDTVLVLPMAGRGSRFSECGYDVPKPLLDVDGKPMIVKAVDCLPKINKKIFICSQEHITKYKLPQTLLKYYPKCSIIGLDTTTAGQACTCEIGIAGFKLSNETPILISACDNGVVFDSEKYMKLVNDESVDVIVWSFRNNQTSKVAPNMYSWLDVDENDNIKRVYCKNFVFDDPLKSHAIIGTMFFRKADYFLSGLKANYKENLRTNNEFYVDDVINQNIKAGLNVKVFEVENYICWGTPNDYKTYNYWKEYFIK